MRRGATRAVAALAAALALTLAVFLLYRGLQRFAGFAAAEQRVGVYFTSGLVFATVGWLGLPGRRLDSLRRRAGALEDLGLGLVASTAIGALALLLGMQVVGPARDPGAALVPLGTAVLAVALWNLPTGRVRRWTSRPLLWVAAALPFLTLLRAVDGGRELSEVAVRLAWLIGVVGFGEELFFRGFLQGRLDRSLGTPWRLPGVQFGPGLLIASAAFGLVHALNPTGPFVGRWEFAPWHGLATGSSLLYGLLRARTGGILAPALLHATVDVAGEFVRAGA